MLSEKECFMDKCENGQDPKVNNCYPDDGYHRSVLYRDWDLGCQPPISGLVDNSKTKTFLWNFHGRFLYGSKAELKCLPSFSFNSSSVGVY